jgi:replicative DNA helicase
MAQASGKKSPDSGKERREEPSGPPSALAAGPNTGGKPNNRAGGKTGSYLPDVHRQLPQSLDGEKGVLGSILLSPQTVLDTCIENGIRPEHFHFPSHALIYELLRDLGDRGVPIDLITLTQQLSDRNMLEKAGGALAITDLYTFVPTAANAEYYLEILREKYLLRQVILTCTEFAGRCYDEQGDARDLLDEVEKRVLAIGEQRFQGDLTDIKKQVMDAVASIEKLYQNKGGITGISTGFKILDQMTSGLHGGEMFVVAARPSMGKTAFAMTIAEHVAVDLGKPVGIFSLEMSSQQLVQRLICSRARIDLQRIRDGFLSKMEIPKLSAAADQLAKSRIYIDDTAGLTILELRAKTRRMRERLGIELLVVDYLQLLRSDSRRAKDNRQLEVAEISYGIKALAKELNIPILILAQLNRQPDEKGGRPMLSHLRESGTIEQDADVVAMLFRAEVYEKDEEERKAKEGEAELIIAKQRNGPVGDVPLTFLKQYTRFEDRASEAQSASEGR